MEGLAEETPCADVLQTRLICFALFAIEYIGRTKLSGESVLEAARQRAKTH